ncbi:acyltransferase [Sphingomonas gei]|uniref:Acyltransferase n=1 Tax=Sphingomonas gei TaxID=1395960 RepID=A0A4S1XB01_9SPHN|nr:acyltransferase [Sphingomonas gei]TGX53509.1 acyltransferase [Sphingomonas gei]
MHRPTPAPETIADAPRRTVHFGLLDGLRGVAAIAVVLMHIGEIFLLPDWFPQAYLAVPFFFVLSGFVISYAYEDGLMRTGRLRDFARVRIERLYPLLLIGLGFGAALLVIKASFGDDRFSLPLLIGMIVAALAMIPLPGPAAFTILPPQWSLAIELWGNIAHFALRRWISVARLTLALPIFFVAMAAAAFVFGGLGTGWSLANIVGGIATFAFCYGAGILIHHLWKQNRLPRLRMSVWLIAGLLVASLVMPQALRTPANAVRDILCAGLLYPLLLVAAIQVEPGARLRAISDWFGRLSYPLYITHFPVVSFCCLALLRFDLPQWALYASVLPIAGVAIVAAWLMLTRVDEPARRWLKQSRKARYAPSAGPA